MLVAIDGPAGAGKSTVARAVAGALGATYLDSGAMYRCVALASLEQVGRAPGELAAELEIELRQDGGVALDGRDVTTAIREPRVSEHASRVAADPAVRQALVAKQRAMVASGTWVAEGRDIGTVVAPGAELKIYLTASARERARRRADELGADVDAVERDQSERDRRDAGREHSPLRPADDALVIDTTGRALDDVVAEVAALARAALTGAQR